MRKIYYRDAVREALDEEMARDPMVMMIGEDIGVGDGTWRCSKGLYEKYGDLRMKDSPISESGIVGMGIGMALTGMRPIVEIMFSDFMLVAMDQIVDQMAKVCYMSGGQKNVPMVIRTTIGAGRAAAAQHSQNLNAVIAHFPGSKIVIPSDAYTAKGLLKSAIRDNNPVIVVEHRKHYSVEFDMPDDGDENLLLPIGKSVVVHEGSDVTVVANSFQVGQCVKVAKHLEKKKGKLGLRVGQLLLFVVQQGLVFLDLRFGVDQRGLACRKLLLLLCQSAGFFCSGFAGSKSAKRYG